MQSPVCYSTPITKSTQRTRHGHRYVDNFNGFDFEQLIDLALHLFPITEQEPFESDSDVGDEPPEH